MNGHGGRQTGRAGSAAAHPGRHASVMAGATLLVLPVYTLIFWTTMRCTLGEAVVYALTSTVPLTLLALPFSLAIRAFVQPLPARGQAVAHALFAPAFAAGWYGGIVILQALARTAQGRALEFDGLLPQALAWQAFQGTVIYVAIAAATYALAYSARPAWGDHVDRLDRYLTRRGDTIERVEVRDIISISGAQDYSQVATLSGRHLARFSLAEFERRLDPGRFVRIHRSGIINLDHFQSAEPAGNGRFLVILSNGEAMQTSRAGARRLRAITY
jgi:two-component system LytT family response regulator